MYAPRCPELPCSQSILRTDRVSWNSWTILDCVAQPMGVGTAQRCSASRPKRPIFAEPPELCGSAACDVGPPQVCANSLGARGGRQEPQRGSVLLRLSRGAPPGAGAARSELASREDGLPRGRGFRGAPPGDGAMRSELASREDGLPRVAVAAADFGRSAR